LVTLLQVQKDQFKARWLNKKAAISACNNSAFHMRKSIRLYEIVSTWRRQFGAIKLKPIQLKIQVNERKPIRQFMRGFVMNRGNDKSIIFSNFTSGNLTIM
jgi:hypothetical protein